MRICRPAIIAPFMAAMAASAAAMLPRIGRAQTTAAVPERLLFVVAAAGGGSILDSFLPVPASEVSSS